MLIEALCFLLGVVILFLLARSVGRVAFSRQRTGFFGNWERLMYRLIFVCGVLATWVGLYDEIERSHPDPNGFAFLLGAPIGAALGAMVAVVGALNAPQPPEQPQRTRVDGNLVFGVCFTVVWSWGYANTIGGGEVDGGTILGSARLGTIVTAFFVSQVIVGFSVRALSTTIKRGYALSRKAHSAVAAAPVPLSAIGYVVWYPAGLSAILLLVAMPWRWTSDPPSGSLGAIRSLWRALRGPGSTVPTSS